MAETMPLQNPLPVGSAGKRGSGWWGLMALIVTEASLFGYLLFAYFYLAAQNGGGAGATAGSAPWPPDGRPELLMPALNTVILLSSSVMVWLGERALRNGARRASVAWLALALAFGTAFALIQLGEWHKKPYALGTHAYGSLYFTITGFHLAHVIVGLAILALLLGWTLLGYIDGERRAALSIGGMYWHFVDAVWLFVFSALYLSPYVLGGRT
jgi:heme/copper-type cytochrome/quinol oxidase subunit 3